MPRLKNQSPKSLFELCAEFIAYNLDRWMCNPTTVLYLSNHCDQEAAKVCSPLDVLPSAVLEEVVNLVRHLLKASSSPDKMNLKKQLFELLITPHSKCLDLSMGDPNDVPHILKLASLKCPDMKSVRLVDYPSYYYLDSFVLLCARKFERLQVLNISKTDARDDCLKILGKYCKGLRKLDLQNCKKITDNGIEGLCVSVNYLGREDQRLGQCKSIETLFINGTEITRKGMYTALVNLPFLKELTISGSCPAVPVQFLAKIHQPDWNSKRLKDIRKYSLESLYLGCWALDSEQFSAYDDELTMDLPYTDGGNLGLVASLCPSVTSVEVKWMPGLTDSDLLGLLCLENVNELKIGGYDGSSSVTFEGGVVPLLKGFENSLKVLNLTEVKDVNIGAIIDVCPKLKCLILEKNYHDQSKWCKMERKPLVMKNLEELSVNCSRENYFGEGMISSEDLLSLFSSPSLINIDIFSCPNLTDHVFERASEIHQFLSLEQLTVCDCESLTRKGIDVVMNEKTPLNQIYIWVCENITDDDIALLISNATSEEWQLSVNN